MLDKEKFQDKGKEEPKFSVVAVEATKTATNQPREMPHVPAKLFKFSYQRLTLTSL